MYLTQVPAKGSSAKDLMTHHYKVKWTPARISIKFKLFPFPGGHYNTMNGEIPGVPITTLAGIASVTDRKFKLLLPIAEKILLRPFLVRVSSAIGLRVGKWLEDASYAGSSRT